MTYVVTSPCVGTHDTACMKVCPVNCFFDVPLADLGVEEPEGVDANPELKNMLIISPDECIDCGLCVPECPVEAIFSEDDVPGGPDGEEAYVEVNAKWFEGKDAEALDAARCEP